MIFGASSVAAGLAAMVKDHNLDYGDDGEDYDNDNDDIDNGGDAFDAEEDDDKDDGGGDDDKAGRAAPELLLQFVPTLYCPPTPTSQHQ